MGVASEQLESMFGSSSAGKSALLAWLISEETANENAVTEKGKAKKNA
jgi:putative ribosome biogenesis GTPase RsgA